jgi:perosamine synthetase
LRIHRYLDNAGIPFDLKRDGCCKTLYEFPVLPQYRRACPNAKKLLASRTTIPVHPDITRAELDYMASRINA